MNQGGLCECKAVLSAYTKPALCYSPEGTTYNSSTTHNAAIHSALQNTSCQPVHVP